MSNMRSQLVSNATHPVIPAKAGIQKSLGSSMTLLLKPHGEARFLAKTFPELIHAYARYPPTTPDILPPVFVQDAIYFADVGNSRIRRVDLTTGVITTVAGGGSGDLGDGGPATDANILLTPHAPHG